MWRRKKFPPSLCPAAAALVVPVAVGLPASLAVLLPFTPCLLYFYSQAAAATALVFRSLFVSCFTTLLTFALSFFFSLRKHTQAKPRLLFVNQEKTNEQVLGENKCSL